MIQINKLDFSYVSSNKLLSDLDFILSPGRICGLLGKNGVGKTTLLRLISGLLFPHAGSCKVVGFAPRKREPEFLREIFYVAEEFYLPNLSGEEYVELYAPFYPKFQHDELLKYLKEFELNLQQRLSAISYGQKKKFLLAFALATDCQLLLLDEPTNGLDIPSKAQFRRLVAANLSEKKSIIIATHQVRDLETLIDTVAIQADGKIIFQQPVEDITRYLNFAVTSTLSNTALYQEQIIGGYQTITVNSVPQESAINLELLFNAVSNNAVKINQLFTSK